MACEFLRGEQKLFTAGTGEEEDQDIVWFTTSSGIEYAAPGYKRAAEEHDTCVVTCKPCWLQVGKNSFIHQILMCNILVSQILTQPLMTS